MADLKTRLAPLEGVDMPDRWNEIRERAPRAGFDPEPPRRYPVAVIALAVVLSVATIGWLATAFRGDEREVARPAPSPTVEPEPEPTLDPKAIDLGLWFGICDADSITGAFRTGESTRVWFGTRTNEETLRCVRSSSRFVLAVDVGGDREAEAWIDPIGPDLCLLDCGLTGVVDLDGDGTDELVILFEGGVTPSFGVVDIRPDGRLEVMGYADGEAPQGIPAHDPVKLTIGGDEAYSFAVSCVVEAGTPLITQQAVAGVVDSPDVGATVATYSLRLTPDGFAVVSDDIREGVTPPPSLPQGSSLCGLELPPLGSA